MDGKPVPTSVTFQTRSGGAWKPVTSASLFEKQTVVVFSLPGAFTPTCSSSHLPRFMELEAEFKASGVDRILCVTVNDAFVCESWAADQGIKPESIIQVIPDGNGEFTEAMGMLVDKSSVGFGKRSWRYSMLVRDGVIEKQFIEPQKGDDPFEVSDAETMLKHINPTVVLPPDVALFTRIGCAACADAKTLLTSNGIAFNEIVLNRDTNLASMRAVTGSVKTPQIFVNGKLIGGKDDLIKKGGDVFGVYFSTDLPPGKKMRMSN